MKAQLLYRCPTLCSAVQCSAMWCVWSLDNEGTAAVQMSYTDRLHLSALTKQVSHGRYCAEVATDVGLLDVFGNDQRYLTYMLLTL